jgi:hypothetical protein
VFVSIETRHKNTGTSNLGTVKDIHTPPPRI